MYLIQFDVAYTCIHCAIRAVQTLKDETAKLHADSCMQIVGGEEGLSLVSAAQTLPCSFLAAADWPLAVCSWMPQFAHLAAAGHHVLSIALDAFCPPDKHFSLDCLYHMT